MGGALVVAGLEGLAAGATATAGLAGTALGLLAVRLTAGRLVRSPLVHALDWMAVAVLVAVVLMGYWTVASEPSGG